ncbi:uncharacterized protein Z518_07855 [Rhinocladiella mackenziei CBS 650.93]|uniref:Zn(2)-C6 fungal-type domain-containing protein n=1 Tax=Rhinocladiella mackenziei CBS 650.93 TaxID=1442369 RepID=A0A0D2IF69_9EURO|nr:uncharacterized protein Z518_07855 [Rhinocladiella mackenziei CBS 650.93]KIX01916.1 hypothetical protein Z518_07855 [Rhinocladiella mackenziei CBS 650.93]
MREESDTNLDSVKSKKSAKHAARRACESCRALKIRCQPAPEGSTAALQGQCQHCVDISRVCVFKEPSRTRAKRTDVRVRELEREVRALSDLLRTDELPKLPRDHGVKTADHVEPRSILNKAEAESAKNQKKRKMVDEQLDANLHQPERQNWGTASPALCPSSSRDVIDIGI